MGSVVIEDHGNQKYGLKISNGGRAQVEKISKVMSGRFQESFNSQDVTTPAIVKAKTTDKKMYLTSLMCSVSGTTFVRLEDDTGTVIIPNVYLAANGGFVAPNTEEEPLVVGTNKDLKVVSGAAVGISVNVVGYLDE